MRFLGFLFVVALILCGVAYYFVETPYGPSSETFVEVPSGIGTVGIASRLADAGVIRNASSFEAYRKFSGGTLKAGEYRFDHPLKLGDVYGKIARGDVYTKTLVIPEGFNIFDIAQAVGTAGLGTPASFLTAEQQDTVLIQDLDPRATSLEGFLFPDTYRFSRKATPMQMLTAIVKRFRQVTGSLGLEAGPDLVRTVTLASLIEKEVNVDAERPLVGGVFINRLATGMPLANRPLCRLCGFAGGPLAGDDLRIGPAVSLALQHL